MALLIVGSLFFLTAILTAVEMATFSARVERMKQADEAGDRRGIMVLAYQRSPMHFLAAVQVVTTAAAFWSGALMETAFIIPTEGWLLRSGLPGNWAPGTASVSILILMTLVSLIFTNVLPKQIGFIRSHEIALAYAKPMRLLIRFTRPLGWLVSASVNGLLRLRHISPDEKHRVTERDIRFLIKEGATRGSLDAREQNIVRRALDLSDLLAVRVMTPVASLEAIDISRGLQEADRLIHQTTHSFLPVYDTDWRNLLGVIKARDWLALETPSLKDLRRLVSAPVIVKEKDSLLAVLEALRPVETRCVFVTDRNGAVEGMITLNDAVSQILGPIKSLSGD